PNFGFSIFSCVVLISDTPLKFVHIFILLCLPVRSSLNYYMKLARFHQIVPIIESGKVFLPHQAIWLNDFEYEILMFPEAHHNDQVDSTVQYLQWMRESTSRVAAIRTL
ncbi:MAG: hypothetical protein LBH78_02070, partial [Rickettsiales bacterium]|nr:hypothetical protein [Rickettsiales bacterium]